MNCELSDNNKNYGANYFLMSAIAEQEPQNTSAGYLFALIRDQIFHLNSRSGNIIPGKYS